MNLIFFRGIKGNKKNNTSLLFGLLLVIGLFLLVVILPNVYACQCIANMPVEQKVIGSDIIFSGKLIEKYENSNYKGFIFEIDKLWKNHSDKILLEQKNISVFTPTQESACGTDFTVGLTYLVYSEMKGERTVTSLCSGSGLLFLKSSDVRHFEENDIQGQEYYQKEHPLIPGSTAKMERDCRDGLLDKYNSPFANGTHWYSNQTCEWLDLENKKSNTVTGSYELQDVNGKPICLGPTNKIVNDDCVRIGMYDPKTGIPIVNNKSECDLLDGTWYEDREECDSKYPPLDKGFNPELIPSGTGYEESENTKLARDRINESDQTFGGPSPGLFDTPEFSYSIVGLVVAIGIIALIFLYKKKPN